LRGYAAIGLHHPNNPRNIGGVMRAAFCFDVRLVAMSGTRQFRCFTDTCKSYRHVPVLLCDDLLDLVPADCVPVAVEIVEGARDLAHYTHPRSAFYLFGPEDGSLPPEILAGCRDVVQIPSRRCLNLAAAVNVVLYDRISKYARVERAPRLA
jgi:tRNA(Leu) C34 or U34 (ribose-2'-O)-methylase TrmL